MGSLREFPLQRILAVRLDNLGDVVLLTPALRCLAEHFPDARITLLASPAGAALAPLLEGVTDVWTHCALWQALGQSPFVPEAQWQFIEALRARAFDAVFVFTSFSQSPYPAAYAAYLAGIPVRVGQARDFGGGVLTHWVTPAPDGLHQAERNLHLLGSVGLDAHDRRLALQMPSAVAARAAHALTAAGIDSGRPYVCVAPGASCAARRYPAARYTEVVRRLARALEQPVVVLGAAKEAELVAQVAGDTGIALAGNFSVPELAYVVQNGRLLVGNDSGPMHIADAFGCPQVILFSGTELESQWRPRTSHSVLLRRPTACSPCYGFSCRYGLECLDVPPSEVEQAAALVLRRSAARARARVA